MKNKNIFKMCCAAVFAAVICILTWAVPIPLPGHGYFNLGDCFVIVAALCLGPVWGGLAAGIGAGLSDLLLGYTYYAPATFVIKWLMAVGCYFVFRVIVNCNKKLDILGIIAGAVVAEVIMVGGYFVFEIPLYGLGVAIADVIGNTTQGIIGAAAGTLVFTLLHKTGLTKRLFEF